MLLEDPHRAAKSTFGLALGNLVEESRNVLRGEQLVVVRDPLVARNGSARTVGAQRIRGGTRTRKCCQGLPWNGEGWRARIYRNMTHERSCQDAQKRRHHLMINY